MNAAHHESSPRHRVLQVVVVGVVVVVGALYLTPRLYDLVATPFRLDSAIVSANNYNPALDSIIGDEKVTLGAFEVLDDMKRAIADVQTTDAQVQAELVTLSGQIDTDIRVTLTRADRSVGGLVTELDGLAGRIRALSVTADGTTISLARTSARLGAILHDTRATAAKVHQTRLSADSAANDLSGQQGAP